MFQHCADRVEWLRHRPEVSGVQCNQRHRHDIRRHKSLSFHRIVRDSRFPALWMSRLLCYVQRGCN